MRVRSRSEFRVAALLRDKAVEAFAPCWPELRTYSDRMRSALVAAFPGYAFCRINLDERLRVLQTSGVQGLVGTAGNPEAIADDVIDSLQKAFAGSAAIAAVPYVREGERVRILAGPMAGAEGLLLRVKGHDRLVISLDLLQRSVAVDVERSHVAPLNGLSERSRFAA